MHRKVELANNQVKNANKIAEMAQEEVYELKEHIEVLKKSAESGV